MLNMWIDEKRKEKQTVILSHFCSISEVELNIITSQAAMDLQ